MYTTTTTSSVDAGTAGAILGIMGIYTLFWLAIVVLLIVAMWKVFAKAGKPGWAAIIPIYNAIVLLEIVGRPIWWILLMLIPFVNLVIMIIVMLDLAKAFGKSVVFAIFGLIIFSPVGWLMLGFGKSTYTKPATS